MTSINENQPEHNREDKRASDAVKKIRSIVNVAQSCFFCTKVPTSHTNGARPMSVRKIDDEGNLWFLSASDSHLNKELSFDPEVKLYFQGSAHSDFLELNGTATISVEQAMIDELWEPTIKNWFTEGKEDPRITVIKVVPSSGYYWDTKHGNLVAGIKIMIGAVVGKTFDDSIEGRVIV